MRKKNCEDQDKKWFIQQEKRSGIAAFFAFTFVAMLGISLMFLVVATLIGLNAF
jgi:hypothetical protein